MSAGIFNTGGSVTDLPKKSFAAQIMRYMPNGEAPLFGISAGLPSETAMQVEHGYFSKTALFPELTTVASIQAAAVTALQVLSTANMIPGMLFQVDSTRENILIDSVVSPTVVNVQRAVGTVAAADIPSSSKLYQVGTAFEEGSQRPNAQNIVPVRITNLTQIFRNTWAVTDTMRATYMIAGDTNVAESKMDCMAFHARDIETGLLFGQKSSGSRNGQPFRTMDGLINIVSTLANYPSYYSAPNVTTAGGTTSYTQLEAALDPVFNQTTDPKIANERVLFVGGGAKKVITKIGRLSGEYQIMDSQTSFGLQFSSFKIARGTFRMIEHPLFNSNPTWQKMAIAIDMSTFRLAYLNGRQTKNDDAIENGVDAVGGTLTTELTCLVKNPAANAVIYNLTDGVAG